MDTPQSVTILGKSQTGIECPFDTDEVWGVNNVCTQPEFKDKKIHKLFAFDLLPKEYTDGMKKHGPICSWQDYADIKYPLEDVIKEFNTRYFTNTVSYMLAYAAFLRIPEVKIFGVDVAFGAAYAQENRGVEYWMGRAQERGINISVSPRSHLMRTVSGAMYGERDHANALLYLHERINLINILPREGTYEECLKSHNAWWVLFPKSDEAEANGVKVQQSPDGSLNFQCPKEFISDVHMPPETWEYICGLLHKRHEQGKLPYGALSIYEKLILSGDQITLPTQQKYSGLKDFLWRITPKTTSTQSYQKTKCVENHRTEKPLFRWGGLLQDMTVHSITEVK